MKVGSNQTEIKTKVANIEPETISQTLGSTTSFFSIVYGIMVVLSIAYNIGYFQYINPQLIDLMSLGDYIEDTIHNLWIFFVAALLFFSSTTGFLKKRMGKQTDSLVLFGFIALIVCGSFLLKGFTYNKYFSVLKMFLSNGELIIVFITVSISIIALIAFITYIFSYKIATKDVPFFAISLVPLLIFLLLVLTPYLGGLAHGYVESVYLTKNDYKNQLVRINIPLGGLINEAFIIKKLSTGLIIRNFDKKVSNNEKTNGEVMFLPWGFVKDIEYKQIIDSYEQTI